MPVPPAVKAERSNFSRALGPEKQACQVLMTKTRWQMTRGLGGRWLSHHLLESQLCQPSAGLQRITLTPTAALVTSMMPPATLAPLNFAEGGKSTRQASSRQKTDALANGSARTDVSLRAS